MQTLVKTKYQVRKSRRQNRDRKIREQFNTRYHQERKRLDDVEQELAEHWQLSIVTIRDILRRKD